MAKAKSKISLKEVLKKLEDKTITVIESGHLCNPTEDIIHRHISHHKEMIEEYEDEAKKAKTDKEKEDANRMLDLYHKMSSTELQHGRYILNVEQHCFHCGKRMYVILIDENTIGYVPTVNFWDMAKASESKYDFLVTKELLPDCSAKPFVDAQKLVAEIYAPSGNLVFQNFFQNDKLYKYQGEEYNSINELEGRNRLMQDLASRNIGYGQMGNMSVTVYSNGKNEIIIGDDFDLYEDNSHYYKENPDKIDDEWRETEKKAKEFRKILKQGKFKNLGDISLSVWRWMCADAKTLKEYDEEPDTDAIKTKVQPGTYVIEHYYDFCRREDLIYSRIKLKK